MRKNELLKLRALLTFQAIMTEGTVNRAAAALHLSQPTLTRSIQNLEQTLGVELFVRRTQGMEPTPYAEILNKRLDNCLYQLQLLEEYLVEQQGKHGPPLVVKQFSRKVSLQQLQHLIEVERFTSFQAASEELNITPRALIRSIRKLETLVGELLMTHQGPNASLTNTADEVIRRSKLAFKELDSAQEEIWFLQGQVSGRLRIGALPLSRTSLVPEAVLNLLQHYPKADISIIDGNYETLLPKLRCGDVDLIVGALRQPPPVTDVLEQPLFTDELAVISSTSHPLSQQTEPDFHKLDQYGWALPPDSAPTRQIFRQLREEQGLSRPESIVEVSSLVAIRALLLESQFLTILSPKQVVYEIEHGMLHQLPLQLPHSERVIGITTQTDIEPTPLLNAYIEELKKISPSI